MTPRFSTDRLVVREFKNKDLFECYELFSNSETMNLFGGSTKNTEFFHGDFGASIQEETKAEILHFWSVTLKDENIFIGFIRLMSYASYYYDVSFSSLGDQRYSTESLNYFDRKNGWEIDYALVPDMRNKGLMREAVGEILEFCANSKKYPIYAKVNSIKNTSTIKLLLHFNFKAHLPMIDTTRLNLDMMDKIFQEKDYGMIYKWQP